MIQKYLYTEQFNAEYLYNKYNKAMLELDYSDTSEQFIKDLKTRYNACLTYLRSQGIGGVLINGTFRDLSN